jgi:hypothetical protein
MKQAVEIILTILIPLRPLLRAWTILLWYLHGLHEAITGHAAEYASNPRSCAILEAGIIQAEAVIEMLIALRTRELLGLSLRCKRQIRHPAIPAPRPYADVLRRYHRLRVSLKNIEKYAQRRANRLKRALINSPLRLDASHQSASPALCSVAAIRTFIVQIASPCAQHLFRARAPPRIPNFRNSNPPRLAATCEVAGACAVATHHREISLTRLVRRCALPETSLTPAP